MPVPVDLDDARNSLREMFWCWCHGCYLQAPMLRAAIDEIESLRAQLATARRDAYADAIRGVESRRSAPLANAGYLAAIDDVLVTLRARMERGGPPTTPVD